MFRRLFIMWITTGLYISSIPSILAQTRGIGIYPGNPAECFAPILVKDQQKRNIALYRTARSSSSLDYNLTAQLLTDGIISRDEPPFIETFTPSGRLSRDICEHAIDGGKYTKNILMGDSAFLEYRLHHYQLKFLRVEVQYEVIYDEQKAHGGWLMEMYTNDNSHPQVTASGINLPGVPKSKKAHSDPNKQTDQPTQSVRKGSCTFTLPSIVTTDRIRFTFNLHGASYWYVYSVRFFDEHGELTNILPSSHFSSTWMASSNENQWVSVDLGTQAALELLHLHWIHPANKGEVLISNNGQEWKSAGHLQGNQPVETIQINTTGRFVRINMTQDDGSGFYGLSELEVIGTGGLHTIPHKPEKVTGNRISLNGGDWRLMRQYNDMPDGTQLSRKDINTSKWIIATVPGTVLTSYVNVGAVPNPNISNDMLHISESYFCNTPFWYRRTFTIPAEMQGRRIFLHLDGINWKAGIFLNGQRIKQTCGAFIRSKVDITQILKKDINVLAICIEPNAHFGSVKEKNYQLPDLNGGILGLDNPTFHASIGWDWNATVRGRNMGIWDDVYLSVSGDISLSDPLITTHLALPDTIATLTPSVFLKNNTDSTIQGTLHGWIGNIRFEKTVTLHGQEEREEHFLPEDFSQLSGVRMPLWWPNTYGTPYLHQAGFSFEQENICSDSIGFMAGLRQVDYRDTMSHLRIFINGKRFVPLGGNWGFGEMQLNYRRREYDAAARYHREQNFTMIRNWVGQTGDKEFYEACDRYGIVVWQDFWLANPADGPDPADNKMFLATALDYLRRIRQHACIGIYCGRNEGYPPQSLNKSLNEYVGQIHPGITYIPSSADDGVSGHGPYRALSRKDYFRLTTPLFHTERGMPCVTTYESLCRMMYPQDRWPQGDIWGIHDFTQQGAQRCSTFNDLVYQTFGKAANARQFCEWAQWINFDGYRAMFESNHQTRSGLLLWMSHPAWPSLSFQTYDYYLEPTAAYFACKLACEPTHIQWNALTDSVQVVHRFDHSQQNVEVKAQLCDTNGKNLWERTEKLNLKPDMTHNCFTVEYPSYLPETFILCLQLHDSKNHIISQNKYVCSRKNSDLSSLRQIRPAHLDIHTDTAPGLAHVTIRNTDNIAALMIRLNLKQKNGQQVLPVIYSDNYFHLMPGEVKQVTIQWDINDAQHRQTIVETNWFNQEHE